MVNHVSKWIKGLDSNRSDLQSIKTQQHIHTTQRLRKALQKTKTHSNEIQNIEKKKTFS